MVFRPRPIVARKVRGLNLRLFFDAAATAIAFDCSSKRGAADFIVHAEFEATSEIALDRIAVGLMCDFCELFLRSGQAPVAMRFGTLLPRAQLAFFSRLGTTSRAADCQRLFLADSHASIMRIPSAGKVVNCDQWRLGPWPIATLTASSSVKLDRPLFHAQKNCAVQYRVLRPTDATALETARTRLRSKRPCSSTVRIILSRSSWTDRHCLWASLSARVK